MDSTVDDYIALHRRALCHAIPCFTSLDTANAFADTIAGRYSPVSYTHLDVYKRQVYALADSNDIAAVMFECVQDVYKRQIIDYDNVIAQLL